MLYHYLYYVQINENKVFYCHNKKINLHKPVQFF